LCRFENKARKNLLAFLFASVYNHKMKQTFRQLYDETLREPHPPQSINDKETLEILKKIMANKPITAESLQIINLLQQLTKTKVSKRKTMNGFARSRKAAQQSENNLG